MKSSAMAQRLCVLIMNVVKVLDILALHRRQLSEQN